MINITTIRAIALGMSLGFVVAVVPSCGTKPTTTKCSRNTCAGCCDAAGDCFNGTSPEACGEDGITCSMCKTGQSCSVGQCRNGSAGGGAGGSTGSGGGTSGSGGGTSGSGGGTSGSGGGKGGGMGTGGGMGAGGGVAACSNLNCAGCCNPVNGACMGGISDTQCGGGGLPCKVCNTGAGQTCVNSACAGGLCDATTCADGCCSNNVCVTSINANQCGLNGAACVTCQGANPACNLDAGVCLGGGTGTGGGSGGTGGFGGFGGFGGSGGLPELCIPACAAGKCCSLISCVSDGTACLLGTCNGSTGKCQ